MRNSKNNFRHIRERTSASQLKTFLRCPYGFKQKYVLGRKPHYHPRIQLAFYAGRQVHSGAETYYILFPKIEQVRNTVVSTVSQSWDMSKPQEAFLKALRCTNHFVDFELLRRRRYDYAPCSEHKIGRKGFYGIVDFFDEAESCLIDFKTGVRARVSADYKIQAAVYAMLGGVKRVHFYFLYDNVIKTVEVTDEMIENVKEIKADILEALETDHFDSTGRCRNCPFNYCCNRKLLS